MWGRWWMAVYGEIFLVLDDQGSWSVLQFLDTRPAQKDKVKIYILDQAFYSDIKSKLEVYWQGTLQQLPKDSTAARLEKPCFFLWAWLVSRNYLITNQSFCENVSSQRATLIAVAPLVCHLQACLLLLITFFLILKFVPLKFALTATKYSRKY